jgi:hypothetical protein
LRDCTNGECQGHGYSVATDPTGDQFVESWVSEKFSPGQRTVKGLLTLSGGTGEFAGITGSGMVVRELNTFRPTEKGTAFGYGTRQYSYKLP